MEQSTERNWFMSSLRTLVWNESYDLNSNCKQIFAMLITIIPNTSKMCVCVGNFCITLSSAQCYGNFKTVFEVGWNFYCIQELFSNKSVKFYFIFLKQNHVWIWYTVNNLYVIFNLGKYSGMCNGSEKFMEIRQLAQVGVWNSLETWTQV